jgi:SAM-dependent methyltransferase
MARYDEAYYRNTYGHELTRRMPRLTREQYWARWLRRRYGRTGTRVIDLGAGLGWFALAARAQGLAACSVDISEFSARRLRSELGLSVAVGSATDLPVRPATMAAIVALDVLEHVADLPRALAELRCTLRPDGVTVLSVPNVDGFGARRKRADGSWFGDRDATHVSLLSRDVWTRHLVDAGFTLERVRSDSLWDVPYPVPIPRSVQRAVLLPIHRVASWSLGALPWSRGDNLVLVGRAT